MPEPHTGGEPGRTRLAPSPTGALHLGNARTFLVNAALSHQHGWDTVLRVEDLDTPRVRPGEIERTIDTLRWLGLRWSGEPSTQCAEPAPYLDAARRLARAGRIYPCALTRSQIEAAASAPQEGAQEAAFPRELRPPGFVPGRPAEFADEGTNWRFAVEPVAVRVEDRVVGPREIDVAADVGDFVVWTKRGQPSYQLAVVVDDARQGITDVVRGSDLLTSAARQALLYDALGLGPPPRQWHLPLVRGPDGRRLAKRHGDTRLDSYRAAGVPAQRVVGLVAAWSGVLERPAAMEAAEFFERFRLDTMPLSDVIFTAEDDRWLLHAR